MFNSGGGTDTVLGDVRPQDVVPAGVAALDASGPSAAGLAAPHPELIAWMESDNLLDTSALRSVGRLADFDDGVGLSRTLAWNSASELASLGNGRGNYLSIDTVLDSQAAVALWSKSAWAALRDDDLDLHGLRHPGSETLDYLIP